MANDDLRNQIQSFIRKNFIFDERRVLKDDESLINSGVIDSTGVLELIAWLEDRYAIACEDHELIADNFDSIERLTGFIGRKLSQVHAAS